MLSFQQLSQWGNMKASIAGSLTSGVWCQVFKKFNPKDIHHHLGL